MKSSAYKYLLHPRDRLSVFVPVATPQSPLVARSALRPLQTCLPPPTPVQHCRNFARSSQQRREYKTLQSSYTSSVLLVSLICGSALLYEHLSVPAIAEVRSPSARVSPTLEDDAFFEKMPPSAGQRGNLTTEQETKLREFWAVLLKTFGVSDPSHPNGESTPVHEDSLSVNEDGKDKKKKKRMSIFRKHENGSPSSKHGDDSDDKYGQAKEFQEITSTQSPESLRIAFWQMVKADHPDALLLRFLRARKWDVDKALVMLISTLSWRAHEMHVDDDIMMNGEGAAVRDSKSGDASAKKEANDFLEQMKLGKSFLHGTDKDGRPLCIVRARLHHGGDQTEKSLERFTVYVIETTRLLLRPPVETGTIVFDMTHFTMANMDYTPVKFMIKVFEANYPESLGTVLVHKAPWLFQGIWKIIKGWLDPVVAAKVHFTNSVEDLEHHIAKKQIIKELGGEEDWEYKYIEPSESEATTLKDEGTREKLRQQRLLDASDYQRKTFEWIDHGSSADGKAAMDQREQLATKLHENYWQLDPYVRARSLYDRVGMIGGDGKVNFNPSTDATKPSTAATHEDDVD